MKLVMKQDETDFDRGAIRKYHASKGTGYKWLLAV
jgi:hypothetical protein